MTDRGYTDRPVQQLSNAELLEEALQVRHSAGYYAGAMEHGKKPEYERLLIEARDRRNQCFAEIKRRLANAQALADVLYPVRDVQDDNLPWVVTWNEASKLADDGEPVVAWKGMYDE
jgi:hypothetical protein